MPERGALRRALLRHSDTTHSQSSAGNVLCANVFGRSIRGKAEGQTFHIPALATTPRHPHHVLELGDSETGNGAGIIAPRMNLVMRGAISERKREPLKTP